MALLSQDVDASAECVHRVFDALHRKIHSLRNHPSIGGWLMEATKKEIRKHYRKIGNRPRLLSLYYAESFLPSEVAYDPLLADNAVTDEEIQLIKQDLMNKYMRPEDREAFLMFHDDGMGIAEIAKRFSTTEGAMRTRLSRLRTMLRDRIKNLF